MPDVLIVLRQVVLDSLVRGVPRPTVVPDAKRREPSSNREAIDLLMPAHTGTGCMVVGRSRIKRSARILSRTSDPRAGCQFHCIIHMT